MRYTLVTRPTSPPRLPDSSSGLPAIASAAWRISWLSWGHRMSGPIGGHDGPQGGDGGGCDGGHCDGDHSPGSLARGGEGDGAGNPGGGVPIEPPVRSCISALRHIIKPASACRSNSVAAVAKRAARSRHSAEGSAMAGAGAANHRPSARTTTQRRAHGRVPMHTLVTAHPLPLVLWLERMPFHFPCFALRWMWTSDQLKGWLLIRYSPSTTNLRFTPRTAPRTAAPTSWPRRACR